MNRRNLPIRHQFFWNMNVFFMWCFKLLLRKYLKWCFPLSLEKALCLFYWRGLPQCDRIFRHLHRKSQLTYSHGVNGLPECWKPLNNVSPSDGSLRLRRHAFLRVTCLPTHTANVHLLSSFCLHNPGPTCWSAPWLPVNAISHIVKMHNLVFTVQRNWRREIFR